MSLLVNDIVAKTGELPSIPTVATRVIQMLSDPKTAAKDLQEVILTDPAMTLQILKIANSAMYGLKREVKTLTHAIMIMGFDSIRSIVLASATKNIYGKKGRMGFSERLLWQHSISSALLCRVIANNSKAADKEEAFIAGLMHNLGIVILNTRLEDEYAPLLQESYNTGIPLEQIEQEQLGLDNREISYHLMLKWNLNENLANAVRWYSEPKQAPPDSVRLSAVLGMARLVCRHQGIGMAQANPVTAEEAAPVLQLLDIQPALWEKILDSLVNRLSQDAEVIQGM